MNIVRQIRETIYMKMSEVIQNFYYEAPVGTALPYAVFSFLTMVDDYDTVSKLHNTPMQISVFSTTQNDLEVKVQKIYEKLNDNISEMIIDNGQILRIEKTLLRFSKSDEIYQADMEFLILIST